MSHNIINAIPYIGKCPNECLECFYNNDEFFASLTSPILPSLEEVGDQIVRVNQGNDSNINKDIVLERTAIYPKKFYCTAIPNFDFPAPVVFTCNGEELILAINGLNNLMMVRVKTNLWNLNELEKAINYYCGVPITISFMRYKDTNNIPNEFRQFYELKKNVMDDDYRYHLRDEQKQVIFYKYGTTNKMVDICRIVKARDCERCEFCYEKFMIGKA